MLSRMLALKTDAGSGALEQMVLAEYCAPHFATHVPKLTRGLRAKLDTLMEALNEQFGTVGRIRGSQGRHLPVGQAARQCRHAETVPGRARRRRRDQSGTGMVDRQGLCRQPAAAVLCQPLARADPRRRRRARRGLPQGVRRAGAKRQCGEAGMSMSRACRQRLDRSQKSTRCSHRPYASLHRVGKLNSCSVFSSGSCRNIALRRAVTSPLNRGGHA